MDTEVYRLYDDKVGAYMLPFFAPNEAVARRLVLQLLEDETSTVSKYPADFHLYWVGTAKADDGLVEDPLEGHAVSIANVLTIKAEYQKAQGVEQQ